MRVRDTLVTCSGAADSLWTRSSEIEGAGKWIGSQRKKAQKREMQSKKVSEEEIMSQRKREREEKLVREETKREKAWKKHTNWWDSEYMDGFENET